ncbi:hypothetical protein IW18_03610 [Flavobacterium hibernum]|uniref:Uncharacterized protein n=1 Tax=Flavobacterium hibernum TaxID=37752 RepID=A0A0D0EFH1_9FLAO|nr:hypothetical protein IW18_03610 [Flavobacterium hibernum]OXA89801.1 hypothetical protein B0A73_05305 [Flavobacterium hibernum]STO13987.1 Uncharacterised protein [Flavobacterium hibernum]
MNLIFIIRHWAFTLLLGPFIFAIINGLNTNWSSKNLFDFFQIYPLMIFMGLLFSLPTYICISILFTVFKNKKIQPCCAKTILMIIVVIGIFITTGLINGTVWFVLAISYSISSITAGIFLMRYFKNETES